MALILSIETATRICSVALHQDGQLLSFRESDDENAHATNLTKFIEQVLSESSVAINELSAVAVAIGPGSYTGLRIGLSTAKGICFAVDKPLITFSTLDALLHEAQLLRSDFTTYVATLDARRLEIYRRMKCIDSSDYSNIEAHILDERSFEEELTRGQVLFVGDAALKTVESINNKHAKMIELLPSAKIMGALAYERYKQNVFSDLAYSEPFYLKEAAAKVKKHNFFD